LARKEPVNQLTQKAESERSRLFALKLWISKGSRRLEGRGASFSSEPVALDLPETTMRVGLEPRKKVAKWRSGSERLAQFQVLFSWLMFSHNWGRLTASLA
jgi:hypothetical protein